jgi:hypothetical protein
MTTNGYILRPLSRHQYGTLKFLSENHVSLDYLGHAHATTLGSLLQRGYLYVSGAGEAAEVLLTKAGEETLRNYLHATLNERSHEGELTERCARLLRQARRTVHQMRKTA